MATLTRWDPFREMATLRRTMDRFFDEPLFETALRWPREEAFSLALDVAEKDDSYIVKASVPGVNPEDIEVTLTDNVLTIKGETKEDKEVKEENYHLRERHYGSFMRSITLPMAVNVDKIDAVNEHGVLTLTIPKSEAVKPKKIAVKTTVNGK
jgi:HSP20 family protein